MHEAVLAPGSATLPGHRQECCRPGKLQMPKLPVGVCLKACRLCAEAQTQFKLKTAASRYIGKASIHAVCLYGASPASGQR